MSLTEGQKLQARRLHRWGHSYRDLAKVYGMHHEALRRLIDPAWRERRKKLNNESRQRKLNRLKAGYDSRHDNPGCFLVPESVLAERDARMALAPASITAALMGDPPIVRSALYQRKLQGS